MIHGVVLCILYLGVKLGGASSRPGKIPAELKRTSAGPCGRRPQGSSFPRPRAKRPASRGGGSRRDARGGAPGEPGRPARPRPARRKPRPQPRARAGGACPPQPGALAPSRPRAGGGLAARAGRGSGASRALGTLAAGAASRPERAPLPPRPRTPGRSWRRRGCGRRRPSRRPLILTGSE